MYLIKDERLGTTYLVFTWENPNASGYPGPVETVDLDYDMEQVHRWNNGGPPPDVCVGRARENPNQYKVFKYRSDLQNAGFDLVPGTPVVFGRWSDYFKLHLDPPDPTQTNDEDWYRYLDKLDEVSRQRRDRKIEEPDPANRDEVAAWVAKRHFLTDVAIREIWYLPQGAPPEEIRLLELNDRFAGNEEPDPIDFGLDVEGAKFRLLVADINSDQLDQIKKNPGHLPQGWSLDGYRTWRRGA